MKLLDSAIAGSWLKVWHLLLSGKWVVKGAIYNTASKNAIASCIMVAGKVFLFANNLYDCVFDFVLTECLVSFVVLGIIVVIERCFVTVDDCR